MIHEGSSRGRADVKRERHSEVKGLAPTSAVVPVPLLHFPSPYLGGGLDCPPLRPSNEHILIVRVPGARGMIQTTSAPIV
jgi:hypothetical protein